MSEDASSETMNESQKRPADGEAIDTEPKKPRIADLRKSLGSSFGTRKAQKRQANRDSNIIDTSNISNVLHSLVETINDRAKTVPNQDAIRLKQEELRPVPKYDMEAEAPSQIYKVDSLIFPAEEAAMKAHISAIKKSPDHTSRINLLAHKRSNYINDRLYSTFEVPEGAKIRSGRIRLLYFASLLMGFYLNRRMIADRDKLAIKLNNPPAALLDSLYSRFAFNNTVDNRNADRLLTHLFVTGLHLDNFASDLRTIQEDLQLRPPQIATLYQEIGCTVGPITEAQRQALNLPKSETKSLKRAVLKVPLTFPKPKRGGPVKR